MKDKKKAKEWGYKKCSKSFDNNEELNGGRRIGANYEPPNPGSIIEEENPLCYGMKKFKDGGHCGRLNKDGSYKMPFDPPNPGSVLEEDPNKYVEKIKEGFGYDYGSGIQRNKKGDDRFPLTYDPPNPGSIVEEDPNVVWGYSANKKWSEGYEPKLPLSVLEEDTLGTTGLGECMGGKKYGDKMKEKGEKSLIGKKRYEPELPVSIVEDDRLNEKGVSAHGWNINHMDKPRVPHFEPQLPVSIVEDENKNPEKAFGWNFNTLDNKKYGDRGKEGFEPVLPISILDNDNELDVFDFIENPEEAPFSVYESKKVFIGKRNHQTEKPLDILEFFLKYWSNENDTILDPTMGSGSVGVACAKLERNFIGFELDEKIYKKAEKRIKDKK